MKLSLITFTILISTNFIIAQNYKKAEKAWVKGTKAHEKNSAYYVYHPKSVKKSIKYFNKALKHDPTYFNALCSRGFSYYNQQKLDLALSDLKRALSLKPNSKVVHEYLGIVYHEREEYDKAAKHYLNGRVGDSSDVLIYFNIALMYEKVEKYELAISYLDTAVSMDPLDKYNYSARSSSKMKIGKYKDAIEDASKALALDSEYLIALVNRGLARYYLGQYEQAIKDFEKTMEIDLGKVQTEYEKKKSIAKYSHNNIGNCYFELNLQDKACFHWSKAIELGYVFQDKWRRIYKIEDPKLLLEKYCGN